MKEAVVPHQPRKISYPKRREFDAIRNLSYPVSASKSLPHNLSYEQQQIAR
jgi:hypothetical protein